MLSKSPTHNLKYYLYSKIYADDIKYKHSKTQKDN